MKLKTKIRAGKIRPNHNIMVHRTAVSSFVNGRIAAQAAETAEVAFSAASRRERQLQLSRPQRLQMARDTFTSYLCLRVYPALSGCVALQSHWHGSPPSIPCAGIIVVLDYG
jgi:hypothetical protein